MTSRFIPTMKHLLVSVILVFAVQANADMRIGTPIPEDATVPTPEEIWGIFAGQSEDGESGTIIYYGQDGSYRTVNPYTLSFSVGNWYVTTASRMCTDARYYWRQDFGLESEQSRTCRHFRRAANGELWVTFESVSGPWFPYSDDGLVRGDRVSRDLQQVVTQLGLATVPDDS